VLAQFVGTHQSWIDLLV